MHSPIVEKLPVVDKTLPPDHLQFAKVLNSAQQLLLVKKNRIRVNRASIVPKNCEFVRFVRVRTPPYRYEGQSRTKVDALICILL